MDHTISVYLGYPSLCAKVTLFHSQTKLQITIYVAHLSGNLWTQVESCGWRVAKTKHRSQILLDASDRAELILFHSLDHVNLALVTSFVPWFTFSSDTALYIIVAYNTKTTAHQKNYKIPKTHKKSYHAMG